MPPENFRKPEVFCQKIVGFSDDFGGNWSKPLTILEKGFIVDVSQDPTYTSVDNSLSVNPTKWSNTPKQFVGNSRQIV